MGTRARRFVPYVTALPPGPVDGQEIFYAADATNGVIWHLRYRSGASGWEFIGGPPLQIYDVNSVTQASSTFADFSTAGPSLTMPLAGDYMVEWTCNLGNSLTAPSFDVFVGIKNASTNPADADCLHWIFTSVQGSLAGRDDAEPMGVMRRKITVATAGDVLKMVGRSSGAQTINHERRLLVATPVKVN